MIVALLQGFHGFSFLLMVMGEPLERTKHFLRPVAIFSYLSNTQADVNKRDD